MNFRDNSEFLPDKPIYGHTGFYPCANDKEWSNLPLPLRCSTWDNRIESVVFDVWFDNYKVSGNVEIHPQNVFKVLFMASQNGTLLYSVTAIRWSMDSEFKGCKSFAKWYQDTTTGCYSITTIGNSILGIQGGFKSHIPKNCYKDNGEWKLNSTAKNDDGKCTYFG